MLSTILAALVPVGIETVKQVANRFFGGVKPTSVAEQIQLDQSEVEKIKALAELDKPIGNPSQWVVDLRASARYVAAGVVIVGGLSTLFIPGMSTAVVAVGVEAANIAFGFLFGSRIVAKWGK